MGVAVILGYALQAVQAGFALADIVNTVKQMETEGVTEADIHTYLRSLAHKNQQALEQA